ncbi:MAG: putative MATE family efflux protein [Planctomycetota bacterium]|jgi:putative MATE family efflux protein
MSTDGHGSRAGLRELLMLAWPVVLSYTLNNTYRINDQFWIKGLGPAAQAAIGATFFVQIMNFAVVFLAVGGTLALVSRAIGAQAPERRDSFIRHALLLGILLGLILTFAVPPLIPGIVALFGLGGEAAAQAESYLATIYLYMAPMVVFPVTDSIFIARGNTRVPMTLQGIAVAVNYCLNPILIYGARAAEVMDAPGVKLFASIADSFGIEEGYGVAGAAMATGIARTAVLISALLILRYTYGTRLIGRGWPLWHRMISIVKISAPASLSIAVYSTAYWLLLSLVLSKLGDAVFAGLGIGFQVFEGLSFPCYLGVAMAGASLVGKAIGARDRAQALNTVRLIRRVARIMGFCWSAIFVLFASFVANRFSDDPDVRRETVRYVMILAISQWFVGAETTNEKVLLGAGYTKPQLWIAPLGNLLRVPLGWFLALTMGLGATGVWIAIDVTSLLKAFLFWREVEYGPWLDRAFSQADHDDARELID